MAQSKLIAMEKIQKQRSLSVKKQFTSFRLLSILLIFIFCLQFNPVASASNLRTTIDQPDDFSGYQIHMIYVVPSDGTDRNLDTNGRITNWLDQAAAYTKRKIGLTPVFDKYKNTYDIGFLKSKYSIAELGTDALNKLRGEVSSDQITALKVAGFVIDGDIEKGICGLGGVPSDAFYVLTGENCWLDTPNYNEVIPETFISKVIVHEWFHTLGVSHQCIDNDLMWAEDNGCVFNGDEMSAIDESRENYIRPGGTKLDISVLPVWLESDRSQKIFIQPEKTTFAKNPERSEIINFWATFPRPVSRLASVKCITLVDGIPIVTQIDIKSRATFIDCTSTIPPLAKINSKVTMKILWEDLWTYSQVSQQAYVSSSGVNSKVCTAQICKAGDVFATDPNLCWKDAATSALQVLTNGEWITTKAHNLSLADGAKVGCSGANKYSVNTRIRLLYPGIYTFRWVTFEDSSRSKISSTGANAPFTVEVREK